MGEKKAYTVWFFEDQSLSDADWVRFKRHVIRRQTGHVQTLQPGQIYEESLLGFLKTGL